MGGSGIDSVAVTNQAQGTTSPAYIVVDGLRLVSYDRSLLSGIQDGSAQGSARFQLGDNYPNPFNPTTAISYQLSAISDVTLSVYDVLGREIAILAEGVKAPGAYTVRWDASAFPSGAYFYQLRAGSFVETKKMVLAK